MTEIAIYSNFEKPENIVSILEKFYDKRRLTIANGNIEISRSDKSQWRAAPLKRHHQISLQDKDWHKIANIMMNVTNKEFLKIEEKIAQAAIRENHNHKIFGGLGILTELKIAMLHTVANVHLRKDELANKLLPLLEDNFHFRYVCPISLDVEGFGSLNALQRIHLLSGHHTLAEIEALFTDQEVGAGVNIRGGFSILNFPDVYVQSLNTFVTSSLKMGSVAYHFYQDSPVLFDFAMRSSLSQQFQGLISPMTDHAQPLPFLINGNTVDPWDMLTFGINCVNSLISYSHDCFNFLNQDRKVMSSEQFQFSSAIHLIYADILALNAHQDEYTKMKMALSALSKLANLIRWRIGKYTEAAWKDLLGSERVLSVVLKIFSDIGNEKIRQLWAAMASKVYSDLAQKNTSAFPGLSEEERFVKLRKMRNCFEHGAFLNNNQFEEIFYQTRGVLPSEIINLPIIILAALSVSPTRFFALAKANI